MLNTRPAKCTFRQRSSLVGLVHCKGDGCKREAALESISAQLFFLARVGAMCAERHKSPRRIRMGSTRNEPDQPDQKNQTKPQNQKPPQQDNNRQTHNQGSGSSPYDINDAQRVQKARVRCKSGSVRSMRGKALLNLYQRCVRANHLAGSFMVTKKVAIALHPCVAKFSMLVSWFVPSALGASIEGQIGTTRGVKASLCTIPKGPVSYEEILCRDVHLARCFQFAMRKFRLSLFVNSPDCI